MAGYSEHTFYTTAKNNITRKILTFLTKQFRGFMNTSNENKEIIIQLYQNFLNQKKFDTLDDFIDLNYLQPFIEANTPLLKAFPDIQFTIKEIFADNNNIITVYDWTGTHKHEYQNIPATHKKVTVEGISIYELKNRKVIKSVAKPDKLSFFLQLGLISPDFKKTK